MSNWTNSIDFKSGAAGLCFGGLFGYLITRSKKNNEINKIKETKQTESKTLNEKFNDELFVINKRVVDAYFDTGIIENKFKSAILKSESSIVLDKNEAITHILCYGLKLTSYGYALSKSNEFKKYIYRQGFRYHETCAGSNGYYMKINLNTDTE